MAVVARRDNYEVGIWWSNLLILFFYQPFLSLFYKYDVPMAVPSIVLKSTVISAAGGGVATIRNATDC